MGRPRTSARTRLNHVPYKGENPAFTDLIAGHVDLAFGSIAVAEPLIRAGKIKPIAVTGKRRSPSLAGVPTVAEQGYPDYEAYTFVGLNVPAGTPGPVIDKLNGATNEVLADHRVREKMLAVTWSESAPRRRPMPHSWPPSTRRWGASSRRAGSS